MAPPQNRNIQSVQVPAGSVFFLTPIAADLIGRLGAPVIPSTEEGSFRYVLGVKDEESQVMFYLDPTDYIDQLPGCNTTNTPTRGKYQQIWVTAYGSGDTTIYPRGEKMPIYCNHILIGVYSMNMKGETIVISDQTEPTT